MKLVKAVANDHCEQRKRTSKDETSASATKRNNGADWLHERCIIGEELIMGFRDGGGVDANFRIMYDHGSDS